MNPVASTLCELDTNQQFELLEDGNVSGFICQDPLAGIGSCSEEIFYKLEETIFAEPLHIPNNDNESDLVNEQKYVYLDKITVEKRIGKRNKYHIDIGDGANPICPKPNCNKRFPTSALLRAHVRKVHCATRDFTCHVCGARRAARYLLARHAAVHEARRVRCPVCSALLSERTSLSTHMRFVHRQGELKCDKCDQSFEKRCQYTRHRASHMK